VTALGLASLALFIACMYVELFNTGRTK